MIGILPERARELYAIPERAEALTGLAVGRLGHPTRLPDRLGERDRTPRERKPLRAFVFGTRFGQPSELL